jgi:Zn-finger nucleic acid-binding protein
MEQVSLMGVAIDRCPKSGGIWLDAGELELIIKASTESKDKGWAESFLGKLIGK